MTAKTLSAPASHGLRDTLAAVGAYFHGLLLAVQWARMARVMSEMSDSQLAQIGVARADIPQRARELVYGEL